MNILIIANDFKPNPGGVAELTAQIARHLHKGQDDVTVLTGENPEALSTDAKQGYRIIRDKRMLSKIRHIRDTLAISRCIRETALNHNADILINNDMGEHAFANLLAAKYIRRPFCIIVHGLDVNGRIALRKQLKRLKRFIVLRKACKIFCNSTFTQQIVRSYGVPLNRTAVLHPCLDTSEMDRDNTDVELGPEMKDKLQGKKVILTLGRVIKRKGIDKTIEALKIVKNHLPDVVYLVAGYGPYITRLKDLARELNLEDSVIFSGYIAPEAKRSYYEAADIFVMPNRELANGDVEGFGIVFLEANYYGLPAIGGNSGGVVDAIEHEVNGLLVDPTDCNNIADCVIKLLTDKDYCSSLGRQGKKRVLEKFLWPERIKKLRKELAGLVNCESSN